MPCLSQFCGILELHVEANKLNNRASKFYNAALLTRCYVQHFLSPYIDSEVNHKRHFIKIPFINKGMEFIDLQSIFKDNLVVLSIPNYFYNSETPIICYKYSKPFRSTISNFDKIVTDINIDFNAPDSCDCQKSNYLYPPAGHVITGNHSFLMAEFAILFLKVLNIYFPLILISQNVVERLLLLYMSSVIVGLTRKC